MQLAALLEAAEWFTADITSITNFDVVNAKAFLSLCHMLFVETLKGLSRAYQPVALLFHVAESVGVNLVLHRPNSKTAARAN